MKVWVDSLLFTSGVPLKTETLRIAAPTVILDLRRRTEKSHFYERDGKYTCLSLEIEQGKIYCDTGRAVKDKNATMKRICRQLVDALRRKEPVLIVCYDGMTTSGFIAMVVRWWYRGCDPAVDIVKEVRDANDFTSARGKEQRAQMLAIKEEALKIDGWEKKGFKRQKCGPGPAAAESDDDDDDAEAHDEQ